MAEEIVDSDKREHGEASKAGSGAHTHHSAESTTHEHHHEYHKENKDLLKKISRYKKYLIVSIFYLAVALVMFYPITLHFGTYAAGSNGGDLYQNLWNTWWVNYSLFTLHTNVFYTKLLFWPIGVSLAFTTLAPLYGLISAPFQVFGTIFAYNIIFFLGFLLSGLGMFILAEYLTKNDYAALISGFIFTFSAFHLAQSAHIHFIHLEFVPLFLYFLLRVINEGRKYTNIIGMAASFALSTLIGNIEQTIMLFLVLIFVVVVWLFYKETRKKIISKNFVISALLFFVLAFIIGAWNFVPLIKAVSSSGGLGTANYLNSVQANIEWSINPIAFLIPSYYNGLFYGIGNSSGIFNYLYYPAPIEKVAYIGFAVLALALYGVYKYKKEMLPWIAGAIIFAWLALGPSFGLYSLYHAVPGLNVIREPGRFDLIASLFIAILAAYGAKALFEGLEKHHKNGKLKIYLILILIFAIMFIENNPIQIGNSPQTSTNVQVPSLYSTVAKIPGNFSLLELPTLPLQNSSAPELYPGEETYYTSITHKPIIGGYVGGRQNVSSLLLIYNVPLAVQASELADNQSGAYPSPVIENFSNQTLLALYNYNTDFVVVNRQAYTNQSLLSLFTYLENTFGTPVYNDNTSIVFQTLSAINRSIFRSFVEYPVLTDWESTTLFLNGSYQTFWVPTGAGSIAVYAPYSNANLTNQNAYATTYINSTISFVAISSLPQTLYLAEPTEKGSIQTIAEVNVSSKATKYTVKTEFVSGPLGNIVDFLYQNTSYPILLNNITFSR